MPWFVCGQSMGITTLSAWHLGELRPPGLHSQCFSSWAVPLLWKDLPVLQFPSAEAAAFYFLLVFNFVCLNKCLPFFLPFPLSFPPPRPSPHLPEIGSYWVSAAGIDLWDFLFRPGCALSSFLPFPLSIHVPPPFLFTSALPLLHLFQTLIQSSLIIHFPFLTQEHLA